MKSQHLANYPVFVILMLSTAFGLQAPWGLLFLYWTLAGLYSGQTLLVSRISRDTEPVLFWAIQLCWIVLGLYMIAIDLMTMI